MSDLPAISSELPDLANSYIAARTQRLVREREVEEMKAHEELLKKAIIAKMEDGAATVFGTALGVLTLNKREEPQAENWEEIWKYIQETGQFDLLHKRLTNTAVKERWDNGKQIPGVGKYTVTTLTVSKSRS